MVGVIIISLQGDELKLAIRLHFQASNNKAEYKASLIGLLATKNVGAIRVLVHLDSQLVVQQVKGGI